MSGTSVKVRFAPSPTGYLHVGGARTALFNWLWAKKNKGTFVLRIEDTDRAREVADSLEKIFDDMRWLGLDWNEGPKVGGEAGPYFQSQRLDIYQTYIDQLLKSGSAYYGLESPEELAGMREQARAQKRTFQYPRPDPLPTVEEGEAARREGRPSVVRFKMPGSDITVHDEILGDVTLRGSELEDFVIQKSDGWPTYHFACVVDDELMGITHVLRGQEHLMNTPKHVALQQTLGFATPAYAHLPVIFNMKGGKMSKREKRLAVKEGVNAALKRHPEGSPESQETYAGVVQAAGDEIRLSKLMADQPVDDQVLIRLAEHLNIHLPEIEIHDFRAAGYLPEALVNFISLLGWSTGDDMEQMTLEETIEKFDITSINKSNAKFDRDKLVAFNTDWVGKVTENRLLEAFKDFLDVNKSHLGKADDQTLGYILGITRGFRTFKDVEDKAAILFAPDEAVEYDRKAVKKVLVKKQGRGFEMLEKVGPVLEAHQDWSTEGLEKCITDFCESNEAKLGDVAQPIRVALTGKTISPPIYDTLMLTGKESSLARIRRTLELKQEAMQP